MWNNNPSYRNKKMPIEDCFGLDCPLGVPHPRASNDIKVSTFPLGCGLCEKKRVNEVVIITPEMRKKAEEQAEKRRAALRKILEAAERRRVLEIEA